MFSRALLVSLSAVLMLGAGCSLPSLPSSLAIFAKDLPADELDLAVDSTITLQATSSNPLEHFKKTPERVLTVSVWSPGQSVAFNWDETFERETAVSLSARSEAERAAGVGEEAHVPEAVYETVSLKGSLTSNALDDGGRLLLPSEWSEKAVDLSGGDTTIIWLSKQQYDELSTTRHTHLALGSLDAGLQQAANAAESVKNLLNSLQGNESTTEPIGDITEIVAAGDWGSYTLKWNGDSVTVPTIQAENKFASYTILANPDNPLILKVELKAWAYGTEALGILSNDLQMSGYAVKAVNTPSE